MCFTFEGYLFIYKFLLKQSINNKVISDHNNMFNVNRVGSSVLKRSAALWILSESFGLDFASALMLRSFLLDENLGQSSKMCCTIIDDPQDLSLRKWLIRQEMIPNILKFYSGYKNIATLLSHRNVLLFSLHLSNGIHQNLNLHEIHDLPIISWCNKSLFKFHIHLCR